MHDIKLKTDWRNEAGQLFKAGVLLRVSLPLAHALVSAGTAEVMPPGAVLPEPAPAPAAPKS